MKTCYIAAQQLLHTDYVKDLKELIALLDWEFVDSLTYQPDIVLYGGGLDINPKLYGQKRLDTTDKPYQLRDGMEIMAYQYTQAIADKPVWNVGICRGMQLLNVLNGGKLQQHVEDHRDENGGGFIHQVEYFGKNKKDTFGSFVNSYHHQMIIPPGNGKSKNNPYEILVKTIGLKDDPEAIYFPKTRTVGVQWHPEWGLEGASFNLFERIINDYVDKKAA